MHFKTIVNSQYFINVPAEWLHGMDSLDENFDMQSQNCCVVHFVMLPYTYPKFFTVQDQGRGHRV